MARAHPQAGCGSQNVAGWAPYTVGHERQRYEIDILVVIRHIGQSARVWLLGRTWRHAAVTNPPRQGVVTVGLRYNPPPGWLPAPEGFIPPPGWQPDPSWPPAPPGWQLVLDDAQLPTQVSPRMTQADPPSAPPLPGPDRLARRPADRGLHDRRSDRAYHVLGAEVLSPADE